MPGFIQNQVNQAIRSASFGARRAAHAGQIGKDPSASGETETVGATSTPKASEIAAKVARENLTDKRDANKMNRAILYKWASAMQETPASIDVKIKALSEKGGK